SGPDRACPRRDRAARAGAPACRFALTRAEAMAGDRDPLDAGTQAAPARRAGGGDDGRGDRPHRGIAPVAGRPPFVGGRRARHALRRQHRADRHGAARGKGAGGGNDGPRAEGPARGRGVSGKVKMLEIRGLNQYYGGSHTLRGIDLSVPAGTCTALLGRNGVGKTTLLRCLMGLLPVRSGRIAFDGKDIAHLTAYQRARLGIGYVPQGREIFPRLTVAENLAVGEAAAGRGRSIAPRDELEALFPALRTMQKRRGGDLSGGQQEQLAIARALVARPRLL